jgi:hypothetical protein
MFRELYDVEGWRALLNSEPAWQVLPKDKLKSGLTGGTIGALALSLNTGRLPDQPERSCHRLMCKFRTLIWVRYVRSSEVGIGRKNWLLAWIPIRGVTVPVGIQAREEQSQPSIKQPPYSPW